MADTLLRFLEKTVKMEGELHTLEHRTVEIAALAVKTSVLAQMQVAGVDNGTLRGVGKKGAKVGVRADITGAKALVRATGPLHLLERNTKAHRVGQQKSVSGLPLVNASGQDLRRRYVNIPGVGIRAWANHPGTRGKYPWAKGVVAAMPIQEKAQGLALLGALRKAYG